MRAPTAADLTCCLLMAGLLLTACTPGSSAARLADPPADTAGVSASAAVLSGVSAPAADPSAVSASPGAAAPVALAQLVEKWPASWTVTGTHSEATYVEHITITRRGDVFVLRIGVTAQGSQSGGTWIRSVRVGAAGSVSDLDPAGCAGDCAALDGMRGYLAAAVLLAVHRAGAGPATGVLRAFGSRSVVCVAGETLYAAAGTPVASGTLALDPCFDRATGAVLAQYAPALGTFGGPTLDTRTLAISA